MSSGKIIALTLFALALALPLSAQNSEVSDLFGGYHEKGSQIISITTGTGIPLFIVPASATPGENRPLKVGASFNLSYRYFIADRLTLGGGLTGAFNSTVGGRTLFLAPVTAGAAWWWNTAALEGSVGLDVGMNVMRLSGNGVLTPFAKAGTGLYYRISGGWSLGAQLYGWFIPEIHVGDYSDLTRYGTELELSISALYHF
jgi:hypothetical protein